MSPRSNFLSWPGAFNNRTASLDGYWAVRKSLEWKEEAGKRANEIEQIILQCNFPSLLITEPGVTLDGWNCRCRKVSLSLSFLNHSRLSREMSQQHPHWLSFFYPTSIFPPLREFGSCPTEWNQAEGATSAVGSFPLNTTEKGGERTSRQ